MVLKLWLLVLGLFSFVTVPSIPSDAKPKLNIVEWKFMKGDNAQYGKADFDDQSWAAIKVPGYWEQNGYAGFDGIAWYRATVFVPKTWKKMSGITLDMGWIDDNDETYVNGELVGSTIGYKSTRNYRISKALLKYGEKNVISVKVIDDSGDGGIWGAVPQLSTGTGEPEFNVDKY